MKKSLCALLVLAVGAFSLFADEEDFLAINVNAKTTTSVYLPSKNQKYPLEDVIEDAMMNASIWNNGDYSVKIYKNTKDLLSSADFKDDYIYGSAITAVTNLHYGFAYVSYYRYEDEYEENIVGWDVLFLYALDDGRFLCVKILDDEERQES